MLFTNKKVHQIPNCEVSRTSFIKFLGVTFKAAMKFRIHIHNLTHKTSRHIGLLYQIKDFMPQYVLKCIYHAHIYPLLTYCNPVWCTTYPAHFLRINTNSGHLDHTRPLLKQTQILKLEDICTFMTDMLMYMNKNNTLNLHTHDYCTCHRNLLRTPHHRLSTFLQSIPYL